MLQMTRLELFPDGNSEYILALYVRKKALSTSEGNRDFIVSALEIRHMVEFSKSSKPRSLGMHRCGFVSIY